MSGDNRTQRVYQLRELSGEIANFLAQGKPEEALALSQRVWGQLQAGDRMPAGQAALLHKVAATAEEALGPQNNRLHPTVNNSGALLWRAAKYVGIAAITAAMGYFLAEERGDWYWWLLFWFGLLCMVAITRVPYIPDGPADCPRCTRTAATPTEEVFLTETEAFRIYQCKSCQTRFFRLGEATLLEDHSAPQLIKPQQAAQELLSPTLEGGLVDLGEVEL
ncbi:MAG: hypothetical protein RRB13_09925 [bacterium]|nr:hypothetical protein [bacterium]